jgi:uncharacterized protein DUF4178
MPVLTAVLLAMVVGSGAYAAWALSKNRRGRQTPASSRGPADARTHDLVDGSAVAWLLAADGELEFLEPVEPVPPLPPPDTLLVAGDTFRLIEAGGGRVARHGDVGTRAMERCRYWRYQGPGGRRIWLDEFRAAELLVGEVISENLLELLPGT